MSLSHVSGASDQPLRLLTVGQALEQAAAQWPHRDALVCRNPGVRLRYAELDEAADRLAAGLLALGLEPGDRVGIWSPNRAEWVVTQFATAKAGLILVNINPAYRTSELKFALNKVGCKALVTAARFKSSDYLGMLGEIAPELAHSEPGALAATQLPALRAVILIDGEPPAGCLAYRDVESAGRADDHRRVEALRAQLQAGDPINIQYTSGTTGLPKGATLSHHNIVNNGFFAA